MSPLGYNILFSHDSRTSFKMSLLQVAIGLLCRVAKWRGRPPQEQEINFGRAKYLRFSGCFSIAKVHAKLL